jgi:hypothetical protein
MYHALGVVAFTYWGRFRKRKRWSFFGTKGHSVAAHLVTQLFVAGSMAFLVQAPRHGLWQSVRILLKLLGLDIGSAP